MSSYSATRHTRLSTPSPLPQALIALAGGVGLFFVLLGAVAFSFNSYYSGRIYPGVSMAGVDLSGMKPEEAAALLSQRLTFPETGKIVFQRGTQVWIAKPADLGLFLDTEKSVLAAYSLGRQGSLVTRLAAQLSAWYKGKDLAPLLVYDERVAQRYLNGIAAQVDTPTVEASLHVNGVNVVVQPGQVGHTLDVQATLAPLEEQLRTLTDGILPLVIYDTPPVIMDVSQQAEIAKNILSAPLTLTLPDAQEGDPGPWTFAPEKLAELLTIERVESTDGAHYQVGLNAEGLRSFLEDLAPKLARNAVDARYRFNDDTRQIDLIQHAVIGRSLDVDGTIQMINERLAKGEHEVPLSVNTSQPAIGDDAKAADLGITELVHQETTYFYGSSASRIQNIKTAASRFDGVMVPPGAVFSMADVLGDVSLDTGYAEALIIYGNRTIKGVGGGVCQVSTTLFRTVFFGGFPVVERHPHAYRVYYYEQNAAGGNNSDMAGLDATVYVPQVDFKFKNDTPYWLLMETYPSNTSLTWKFYSTSDGRSVSWDTTGLQNVAEPPAPLYQENDKLAKGEINQVDWAVEGADVTVDRTVERSGQVYFQDSFTTHYIPWRAVYEYGPGTKLPKEAKQSENN
jgi:vancomycin resistance protein YoaR